MTQIYTMDRNGQHSWVEFADVLAQTQSEIMRRDYEASEEIARLKQINATVVAQNKEMAFALTGREHDLREALAENKSLYDRLDRIVAEAKGEGPLDGA